MRIRILLGFNNKEQNGTYIYLIDYKILKENDSIKLITKNNFFLIVS